MVNLIDDYTVYLYWFSPFFFWSLPGLWTYYERMSEVFRASSSIVFKLSKYEVRFFLKLYNS